MSNKKEFVALDWLRFMLAVYLVFYHTWHEYIGFEGNGSPYRFLGLGNMATSVFFVLSGFLLTHVYASDKQKINIDKRKFWVARFSTLYPLHIVGLLLSLPTVILSAMGSGGIEVPLAPGSQATRILGAGEIALGLVSNLTLTHAWNPLYLLFDAPSWSLSALLFFYLLFPWFASRFAKLRSPVTGLLVIGLVFTIPGAVAYFYNFTGLIADGVLHRNPIVRLPLFLSGILLYGVYRDSRQKQAIPAGDGVFKLVLVALIGLTVFIAAEFYIPGKECLFPLVRNGLYFPAALAVVWLAANMNNGTGEWNRKWSVRLGKSSLSIFMLHLPLFALSLRAEKMLRAWIAKDFDISDLRSVIALARDLAPQENLYLVHVAIIVLVCVVFQERAVTPLQNILRKKMSNKAVASAPIATLDESKPRIIVR